MSILILNSEISNNNIISDPSFNINKNIITKNPNNFYTIDSEDTKSNSNTILHNNNLISSISPTKLTILPINYNNQIDKYHIWNNYIYILTNFNEVNPNQISFAPSYPVRFYL